MRPARHRMIVDLSQFASAGSETADAAARCAGARWREPRVDAAEAERLARLMLESYRGTIDDEGDTIEVARVEVRRLLAGEFGEFDGGASIVLEARGEGGGGEGCVDGEELAAATLVTRHHGAPFVAFSMTAPAWKRRGLARAGLRHAMGVLAARGEWLLRLVVTEGNPAEGLYAGEGFVREVGPPPG